MKKTALGFMGILFAITCMAQMNSGTSSKKK